MPRRYVPQGMAVIDPQTGQPVPVFERFCRELVHVPVWVREAEQTTLAAALSATTLATARPDQQTLYQLSYYARIVRAATTSSELVITLRWTDGGVAQSRTFSAITTNTTTTTQIRVGELIRADAGTAVTLETTYASVGAQTMAYDLIPSVEEQIAQTRAAA